MKKKILVTGGSGFLGSHLADYLVELGHEVFVYDKNKSKYLNSNQKMITGTLEDTNELIKLLKNINIIYHFAADAELNYSTGKPLKILENNFLGTARLLEAVRNLKNIEQFIFASTVYVSSDKGSIYRVSKHACEMLIEEYHKSFNINYTILRFGTIFGTRATGDNSVKRSLKQAYEDKKIMVQGDGEEIREFIHVKDAVKAAVMAMEKKYYGENLLITGLSRMKISELMSIIKEIFNSKINIKYIAGRESHYKFTPYTFKNKLNKKIILDSYHDLGEGLIEILDEFKFSNK
jgi:UDP-glucose 4-epimerase